MKILIADDSEFIRVNLIKILDSINFEINIIESRNTQESIRKIRTEKPDIVLLDIKMPGGSGFDVLKYAKSLEPSPLVIMLTNYNYEYYRDKSKQENADYFLDKSTEFMKITEIINKYKDKN